MITFRKFIDIGNRLNFVEREQLDAVFGRPVTPEEWERWNRDPISVARRLDDDQGERLWLLIWHAASAKTPSSTSLRHRCQFGSGAELSIGENSAHAVLAVREPDGRMTSLALTPDGLRKLAASLEHMAGCFDAKRVKP